MSTVNIYKITSSFTDKVYIGQTKQTLRKRFTDHKWQDCSSKELLKFCDAKIELLEECSYETRKERELHYINLYGDLAVNKVKPTRTKKEWYEDNKEVINARKRKLRQDNPELIRAINREYREANKDRLNTRAKERRQENKEEVNKKDRLYREANKDKINAKKRDYWQKNKEVLNARKRFRRRFQNTEFGSLCKGLANYF